MQCLRCNALNPEGQRYCGTCGASLDPRLGPLKESLDALLREQIAAAIQEQFKNQKVVENELTETIIQRLSDWAKFYVGIPLAILVVALGFFGYEKLSDLDKLVEGAKQKIKPELDEVKTRADDLKSQAERRRQDIETIFGQERSEVDKLKDEGHDLELTFNKFRTQASQFEAATQEISKAANEARSANAKAADVESKFRTLATGLGCTALTPIAVSCVLPFESIQRRHPIDACCGLGGTNKPGTPQAAQDLAKNNFCAKGTPVTMSFGNFIQLQHAAEVAGIPFGRTSDIPSDRVVLHNLVSFPNEGRVGEGSVARLAAYVIDAHYSNVSSGESVNCRQAGIESNDIHVTLGQNSNKDDPCTSITAEVSPHFRPDVWTPDNLNRHNTHLFRVTGQLFFDASHRPCAGGTAILPPKRASLWEIHPVYAVEICIDPNNNCKVESGQNWVLLSDFVGTTPGSNETQLRLPNGTSDEFHSAAHATMQSRVLRR